MCITLKVKIRHADWTRGKVIDVGRQRRKRGKVERRREQRGRRELE